MHYIDDLIRIFNLCFEVDYKTQLIKGGDEPIYLPAEGDRHLHGIYFAHGFFSSALHECAHWLIAGEARRLKIDFGYWYFPEGRTATQQALFEKFEIKPQALEWILSDVCGYPFHFSFDSFNLSESNSAQFEYNVTQQKKSYLTNGLPKRAQCFYNALKKFYCLQGSVS